MVCRDEFKNIISFPTILIFLFDLMICKQPCECSHSILHALNQQEKTLLLLKKLWVQKETGIQFLPMRFQHSVLWTRINSKLNAFFYFAHAIYIKAAVRISCLI